MTETRESQSRPEAILAVEGLDGVHVGPSDLGLSMGHQQTPEPTEPEALEAVAPIPPRAEAAG